MYLEKQVWDFTLKAKKKRLQNLLQIFQKNNQLKSRFNWLLHAFIAWRKVIMSGIAGFVNLLYLNLYKWIPRYIDNMKDKSNTEGPKFFKGSNLKIWQSFVMQISDFFWKVQQGLDVLYMSTYQSLVLVSWSSIIRKSVIWELNSHFFVENYWSTKIQFNMLFYVSMSNFYVFYLLFICFIACKYVKT